MGREERAWQGASRPRLCTKQGPEAEPVCSAVQTWGSGGISREEGELGGRSALFQEEKEELRFALPFTL